jgi:hypothetical protein
MTEPFRPDDEANPSPTTRIPTPGGGIDAPPPSSPASPPPPLASAAPTPPPTAGPSGTGWTTAFTPPRQPTWRPSDHDTGRTASVLVGLAILAIGVWFFLDHTLQLDMPTIRWSQLWPVFLIGVGVWVLIGARRRPG